MPAGEMKICTNCGKEHFKAADKIRKNTTGRFFCCPECKQEYNRKKRQKAKCDYCGKDLEIQPCHQKSKYHFCNQECHNNFERMGPHTTGSFYACEQCGKQVWRVPSEVARVKHIFCSSECAGKFRRKRTTSVCPECGKEFEHAAGTKRHYCSVECEAKAYSKVRGKDHKDYKSISTNCEWCGKKIVVAPYRTKTHVFCGEECRREWYKHVYVHTEEAKEKFREGAARSHEVQDGKRDTAPQRTVNDLLDELAIEYKNEHIVYFYAIDNYLPQYNLAIEVNGDYWHNNPCTCSVLTNIHQIKKVSTDRERHEYLTKERKIPVLYLWEKDINDNPGMVKELIRTYVNERGALGNFHSFNYMLDDMGKLQRTPATIVPYTEYAVDDLPIALDLK